MRNMQYLFKTTLVMPLVFLLFSSAAAAETGNSEVSYKRTKENTIVHQGYTYEIDEETRRKIEKKYPILIEMLLTTKSMEQDERQYWLDILPSMTDDQVDRLNEILSNERKKLEALEKEYVQEIERINQKHLEEWERGQNAQDKQPSDSSSRSKE